MNRRLQREFMIAIFVGLALGMGLGYLLFGGDEDPEAIRNRIWTGLVAGFACVGVAYARNYHALRAEASREPHRARRQSYVGCGLFLLILACFFLILVVNVLAG